MKQISLSRDSFHSRMYSKITGLQPPMSLCPYFWIWVSIIVFSPLILLYKGLLYIHSKVRKHNFEEKDTQYYIRKERRTKRWGQLGKIVERIVYVGFFLFGLIVIGYIVYTNFKQGITWSQLFDMLKSVGLFVLSLVVVSVTLYFINKGIDFTFNPNNKFTKLVVKIGKFFTIIGKIIYSKYKKVCPIIKWE